ncbi:hypothetical protein VKT23_019790 [Stygiomarasmius scandens]|uniref:Taste receptor type 2 n=1 Tax=Marasmiellus scandens TaxID=2682957 RepID=A0ABR1IKN3_9AGAR
MSDEPINLEYSGPVPFQCLTVLSFISPSFRKPNMASLQLAELNGEICVGLLPMLIPLVITIFLYGINFMLFLIAIYVLWHRQRINMKIYIGTSCLIFIIATVQAAIVVPSSMIPLVQNLIWSSFGMTSNREASHNLFSFNQLLENHLKRLDQAKAYLFTFANLTADGVLVFRSYAIGSSNKWVLLGLTLISIGNNAFALVSILRAPQVFAGGFTEFDQSPGQSYFAKEFLYITFAVTLLLSALIAGKILFVHHKAQRILGKNLVRKYNSAVSIILESGIFYCVSIMISAVVITKGSRFASATFYALLSQTAGIASSMVIVRAGLGVATGSVEDAVSQFQSANTRIEDVGRKDVGTVSA